MKCGKKENVMSPKEWNPGTLLEVSGGYWQTCILHAAVELDIFTAIGESRLTADALAEKLGANARALTMLLNAVTAMNLLTKTGEIYLNTPEAVRFLTKDSPAYIGHIIKHHHHLVPSWSMLDQSVTSGEPARSRASFNNDGVRESFLMGMFNIAMNTAPRIVPKIDLKGRKNLLDFGGGPGSYAIQFCLKNPELQATVFDLPTTRTFAESTIKRFELSDRIRFMSGSYLEDAVEGKYDVAWLSQILHSENPDNCLKIIQHAVSALVPGGMIMIHEFILNNDMNGPLFPALFSLNMLLGTPSGQSYSERQLSDMLAEAGIRDIYRITIDSPNDSGIVCGTV
jgi:predicted O-methyltransferase YrrM